MFTPEVVHRSPQWFFRFQLVSRLPFESLVCHVSLRDSGGKTSTTMSAVQFSKHHSMILRAKPKPPSAEASKPEWEPHQCDERE